MTEPRDGTNNKSNEKIGRPTVSAGLQDGTLVEMVYRPVEHRSLFAVWKDSRVTYERDLLVGGERLVPYSPRNNLLVNDVVLLPTEAEEYENEERLLADIHAFIHRYVDVSPFFEEVACYYVLFSWVYDAFNELPYLRLRGDPGSGKTRFLLTAGALCYKPIFASGASTVSPLFRILDAFRGTLIIDEGDFRLSDERAEIVKILNNGNARGFPVLRTEVGPRREFNPTAYAVFGPKIVATRGYFEDRALESRCLTEEMGQRRLREDVPISLPDESREEALRLRNRLLLFRFRSWSKRTISPHQVDRTIEPRLSQIFLPLLSIIEDERAREDLRELARRYNRELIADRGLDTEAQVLEVIRELRATEPSRLSVKDITAWFADRHGDDYERKVTTKWIGNILRRRLHLRTEKSHGVYVLSETEGPRLQQLYDRYGIDQEAGARAPANVGPDGESSARVDLGDVGDLQDGPRAGEPNSTAA